MRIMSNLADVTTTSSSSSSQSSAIASDTYLVMRDGDGIPEVLKLDPYPSPQGTILKAVAPDQAVM